MRLIDRLRPNRALRRAVEAGYLAVVAQARQPAFYRELEVPDSLDGRFEMIVLHVFLVLHRLREEGREADAFSQALLEALVEDCDRNLREIGVGDLSVGRKVKQMAAGFYGRAQAYEAALAGGEGELEAALRRNVYGTREDARAASVAVLADYVLAQHAQLGDCAAADLTMGRIAFAPAPRGGENH